MEATRLQEGPLGMAVTDGKVRWQRHFTCTIIDIGVEKHLTNAFSPAEQLGGKKAALQDCHDRLKQCVFCTLFRNMKTKHTIKVLQNTSTVFFYVLCF